MRVGAETDVLLRKSKEEKNIYINKLKKVNGKITSTTPESFFKTLEDWLDSQFESLGEKKIFSCSLIPAHAASPAPTEP